MVISRKLSGKIHLLKLFKKIQWIEKETGKNRMRIKRKSESKAHCLLNNQRHAEKKKSNKFILICPYCWIYVRHKYWCFSKFNYEGEVVWKIERISILKENITTKRAYSKCSFDMNICVHASLSSIWEQNLKILLSRKLRLLNKSFIFPAAPT